MVLEGRASTADHAAITPTWCILVRKGSSASYSRSCFGMTYRSSFKTLHTPGPKRRAIVFFGCQARARSGYAGAASSYAKKWTMMRCRGECRHQITLINLCAEGGGVFLLADGIVSPWTESVLRPAAIYKLYPPLVPSLWILLEFCSLKAINLVQDINRLGTASIQSLIPSSQFQLCWTWKSVWPDWHCIVVNLVSTSNSDNWNRQMNNRECWHVVV